MHEPIKEGLEDFLQGSAGPEFLAHLKACPDCRTQVERMREQAAMVRLLCVDEEMAPAPGFYARVTAQIEAQGSSSIWSVFLQPVFGRRLMYACLTMVVLLGTYLVTVESSEQQVASTAAEQYLADEHPAVGTNPQHDRDVVLVRLATFDE